VVRLDLSSRKENVVEVSQQMISSAKEGGEVETIPAVELLNNPTLSSKTSNFETEDNARCGTKNAL